MDCYIKIYHVNAIDKIILLYPNVYQSDNYIKAGKILQNNLMIFLILTDNPFYFIGENTHASQLTVKKSNAISKNNALVSEATLAYIISE